MNRLRIVVLLVAALLIPLGTVHADGSKTKTDAGLTNVWAKLQAAVEAGKMSAEDAEVKMIAIKKARLVDDSKYAGKKDIDYEAIGKKLKAAVKAGKLTEEQAWAKWKAIKRGKGSK